MSDEDAVRLDVFRDRALRTMARIAQENETPEGKARIARFKEQDRAREAADFARRMDSRGIPALRELRAVATIEDPPRTRAMRVVRWALTWRGSETGLGGRKPLVLVLSGSPGCGKSCAGAWAVAHSYRSLFVPASRVASTPDNGFSDNVTRWEEWRSIDLLVLDELGDELARGDVTERITTLLSDRYNDGRATIVTTNIACDAFIERYLNDRLVSRLLNAQAKGASTPREARERGGCPWWMDLPAVDYRVEAARLALEAKESE